MESHELTIHNSGEADATCSCGKWRLLRMAAGGETMTPTRDAEIREAYEQHVKQAQSS